MDDDSCRSGIFPPSRKRLITQLIYKPSILKAWGKSKRSLHEGFFNALPPLLTTDPAHRYCLLIYGLGLTRQASGIGWSSADGARS